jgi:CDP-diacylglycerol--serine O-phosphatidyltransferase
MTNERYLPLVKIIPNAITLLSLCCGLNALKMALAGQFEKAVIFVILASFLDVLDGRFARLLNAQSSMGANLDSLCDFINFGFVPVFTMYLWAFKDVKIFGWGAVLITTVCTCIRLARFNTQEDARVGDPIKSQFFSGIPSPAGGILILAPITLSFDILDAPFIINPQVLIIYTIIIALLMASTIPTVSTKKIKIKHSLVTPVMIAIGILFIFTFLYGWLILLLSCISYLLTIPYSVVKYKKMCKNAQNK